MSTVTNLITIEARRLDQTEWATVNSRGGPVRYTTAVAMHKLNVMRRNCPQEEFRLTPWPFLGQPRCHDDVVFGEGIKAHLEARAKQELEKKGEVKN